MFFIDREGRPYNGFDISMRIIRSGKRNILSSVGSVTTLKNPIVRTIDNLDSLVFNADQDVIAAQAGEFRQFWNIDDTKKKDSAISCVSVPADCVSPTDSISCNCTCLRSFIDYLKVSRKLFLQQSAGIQVSTLVSQASAAGFPVNLSQCPILETNSSGLFYALTLDSVASSYSAKIGNCTISIAASDTVNFYNLKSNPCTSGSTNLTFYDSTVAVSSDTITKVFYPTKSLLHVSFHDSASLFPYLTEGIDTAVQTIISYHKITDNIKHFGSKVVSYIKFDSVTSSVIPLDATIQNAKDHRHSVTGMVGSQLPFIVNSPAFY